MSAVSSTILSIHDMSSAQVTMKNIAQPTAPPSATGVGIARNYKLSKVIRLHKIGLLTRNIAHGHYTIAKAKIDPNNAASDTCSPRLLFQRCAAAATAVTISLQAVLAPMALAAAALDSSNDANTTTTAVSQTTIAPLIVKPDVLDTLLPLPKDFPPLPPLKLPKMDQITLKNGLRVILLEDREAPLVRGTLFMRGGQRASPQNKSGLASIAAAVQRSGGSVQHPGSSLDNELEELAAAIEGGAGSDSVNMGFSCLAEDAPYLLHLFTEVVTTPAIPQSKLDVFKAQALNSLEHKNDNAGGIPAREVSKLVYGKDSPYAREPTIAQVSSITADDTKNWLATWERPDTAVLGLVGDFDPVKMAKLVEETLGTWTPAAGVGSPPPQVDAPPLPSQEKIQGKIYLVDRPGSSQASIVMAEPGIQMMDPDEVELDVLSGVLNSFGGRLFDEIRSKAGLAYSVSGGWASVPPDHPGLFLASAETAQPAQLLSALRKALSLAATTAPTVEEVERAREESLNSFIFGFASTGAQLRRSVAFTLLGIPQDYPFTYKNKLTKVTADDIKQAAQRHLHPEKMVTVVVGDAKKVKPQIEKMLGTTVEMLKLENDTGV